MERDITGFSVQESYKDLVIKDVEGRLESRFKWAADLLLRWIEQKGYVKRVAVLTESLEHALVDYFTDIDRLKEFAQIEKVNEIKIYSYLAFWLLRRKPLQVIDTELAEELVFVNEDMVADLLMGFLYSNPEGVPIASNKQEDLGLFEDTLRYFFRYRTFTAQGIELILLAFAAGRGYQYSVDYRK